MKKMILFFIIIVLISSCKKDILLSPKENKLVAEISKNKLLIDKTNYKLYYQLKDSLTINKLVYLTNHKSANVRCLAFTALAEKNYPKIQDIFFQHINDSIEKVQLDGGCVRPRVRVNNYMLLELHPVTKCKYRFGRTEFNKLFNKYYRVY